MSGRPSIAGRGIAVLCLTFALGACAHRSTPPPHPESGPTIRPLLGVNSGPGAFLDTPGYADLHQQYRDIGVETIRLHDYFGANDLMCYLPNPTEPNTFDWTATDEVYREILAYDFVPMLRLGQGWRNMRSWGPYDLKVGGYPGCPFWEKGTSLSRTMLEHGPDIFTQVVGHLNDPAIWGRKPLDGAYVEIWNEANILGLSTALHPCGVCTEASGCTYDPAPASYEWDGSPLDYYRFFAETAKRLHIDHPNVKIGGPGLASLGCASPSGEKHAHANTVGRKWTRDFLAYLRDNEVPLDFFSWHVYDTDPASFTLCYENVKADLEAHGYGHVEHVVSEFNTNFFGGNSSTVTGAVQATSIWVTLQKETPKVTRAFFYRGNDGPFVPHGPGFPLCVDEQGKHIKPPDPPDAFFGKYGVGLFTTDGTYKPMAAAYEFWSKMVRRQRVEVAGYIAVPPDSRIYTLGGFRAAEGNEPASLEILIAFPEGANQLIALFDAGLLAEEYGLPHIEAEVIDDPDDFPRTVAVDPEGVISIVRDAVYRVRLAAR